MIDPDWVLTAGHCCAGQLPLTMHVVAGGIELNNFEQEEQTRNLIKIIGHPNYDSATISNDVCLLHLQESLTFNDWVQPLPLPGEIVMPERLKPFSEYNTAQGQETDAGTSCTVTGWGTTSVSIMKCKMPLKEGI